jgi:bloom syndrome protein
VAGAMRLEFPQSTNVSSPVQQATRRRKGRENHESDLPLHANGYLHDDFVVPDNQYSPATEDSNDSDESESFEPVRVKGVATKVSKRALSTPITTDREMATLNPIHKDIVESFLVHAKKEAEEVSGLYQPLAYRPCSHPLD